MGVIPIFRISFIYDSDWQLLEKYTIPDSVFYIKGYYKVLYWVKTFLSKIQLILS